MTSTMEVAKGMITSGKCDATDNHSIAPMAMALLKVGVEGSQIQRENLVGEAYTDIPSVVAGLRNAKREWSAEGRRGRGTIECIGRSKPLTAELTRDVHAHTAAAERRARRSPLAGDRCVVAPGAEVQEVR